MNNMQNPDFGPGVSLSSRCLERAKGDECRRGKILQGHARMLMPRYGLSIRATSSGLSIPLYTTKTDALNQEPSRTLKPKP